MGSIGSRDDVLSMSSTDDMTPRDTETLIIEPENFETSDEAILHVKQCIKQNLPMHIFKSMQEYIEGDSIKLSPSTDNLALSTFRGELSNLYPMPSNKRFVIII